MNTLESRADPADGTSTPPRPRVAMFVMNPCHADARVRREAQALVATGYRVRIFALASAEHPAGVLLEEEGFEIERLLVQSLPQDVYRLISRLGRLPRRILRGTAMRLRRVASVGRRSIRSGTPVVSKGRTWLEAAQSSLRRALRSPLFKPLRRVYSFLRSQRQGAGGPGSTGKGAERSPLVSALGVLAWPVLILARFLAASGRAVASALLRVARTGLSAAGAIRRGERKVLLGVRQVVFKFHRPSVFRRFWKYSSRAARRWEPDIVHAHDLNVLPGAVRTAGHRLPVVYDSHELWRHRNRGGELRPLGRLADAYLERRFIHRAQIVITVSPAIGRWLQDHYHLKDAPLILRNVPVGRREVAEAPSLRELADARPHERILLYTGGITTSRGLEELIDVLGDLPDDLLVVLLGYGRPDYIDELMTRARRLGVRDRIRKVAAVSPDLVPAVASQADLALVYIQPACLSYYYCLPNKLFEALQAGLPVVATDLPEMRAVLQAYGAGELCAVGDPAALAAAVAKVLAAPDVYRRGAERAALELRWDLEKERLLSAYESLRPEGRPPVEERADQVALPLP